MRTRYTVWEWTQSNGWILFFGSNEYAKADQIKRALKGYQPQNWYDVYGTYEVPADIELVANWQGRLYSWGWTAKGNQVSWIAFYSLTKLMQPTMQVGARNLAGRYAVQPGAYSSTVTLGMPNWLVSELNMRYKAATNPAWAAQYAPQYV